MRKQRNKIKKEKRPWGGYEQFTLNEKTTIKILTIKPKQKFSLQYHNKREEFWKFLDNPAKVTVDNKCFRAEKGEEVVIPAKSMHRIEAYSKPVSVLEISFGIFEESDIKRIEDVYGRK